MRDEEMNIPHLFRCPISLDLFEDPVTLCTGQTYDRSSIERWLKAGNLTCPVTMQKLHDPSLVPNHTLQHLIHHWLCMDNPEDDPVYTFDSGLSLLLLKHDIESRDSTFKTRIEALRRLTSLSEELEWRKTRLVKLGFFEPILKLVFSLVEAANLCPEDSDIAEESLHCLLNLLPCIQDMRPLDDMLKQSSHLATFQVLLEQGSKKMKINLCSFIEALTSSLKTREICSVLGQTQSLVRGLLHLVSGNDAETAEAANKAVLALCSLESNRDCFTKEGAVDSLVLHLSRRNQTSVAALTTLELLLESDTARNDLGENPNGVRILVKMVFGVCFDHKGSESAVSSLLSVCYESAKARDAAISAGVLTQLLLLLQSQCSSRAKNKGRVLLKLLRST